MLGLFVWYLTPIDPTKRAVEFPRTNCGAFQLAAAGLSLHYTGLLPLGSPLAAVD
jgi:hypothetical protein